MLAATASADFSAKLWDAVSGNELHTLQHSHIVRACQFAEQSPKLITGGASLYHPCSLFLVYADRQCTICCLAYAIGHHGMKQHGMEQRRSARLPILAQVHTTSCIWLALVSIAPLL